MKVTFPEPRFAVEHRPKGARRWTTIVVVGNRATAAARAKLKGMYDRLPDRLKKLLDRLDREDATIAEQAGKALHKDGGPA